MKTLVLEFLCATGIVSLVFALPWFYYFMTGHCIH